MTKPHKIILDASGDIVGQALAAKFSLTLERPTGKPAFHVIQRGESVYCVVWNKASVRVCPQQDT